MENKATIYKGEVMHDLKALFDNAGNYFEDEYELVKQYIEQLEQALDKACELLADGGVVQCKDCSKEIECTTLDTVTNCRFEKMTKDQWKEWFLQN
ncbi:hypothetical protein DW681_06650 [Thomasclavelia ramosa]|uniref:hypothetical protein n=1 Tax=Thomasclavelia ramosa TaxID=1547 RepID=UPI000E4FABDE|nr:hypothetical protein [Thomasclavelia ramosa]RHF42616.1 hypothetical protein DW681_06650 [Thomasclavelia ramosa]